MDFKLELRKVQGGQLATARDLGQLLVLGNGDRWHFR